MARKTLEDFNNDYWAYANYLQSAECANDEGYDTYVDVPSGNIYESDDWTKGHGHRNVFAKNWKGRDKDDPESQGRPWENRWFCMQQLSKLSFSQLQVIEAFHCNEYIRQSARFLLQTGNYSFEENNMNKNVYAIKVKNRKIRGYNEK